MKKPKKWSVAIYTGHVGFIDQNGNIIGSIAGKPSDPETRKTAALVVRGVNAVLTRRKS